MAERMQSASVGVGVLVLKNGELLLIKREHSHGAGTWGMPGGYIDFGETPEQTCARETQEELGVTIGDIEYKGITNDVFASEGKHFVTVWFTALLIEGEPHVNAPDQLSEVGWFPLDALPQPLFLPLQNLFAGRSYPPNILR